MTALCVVKASTLGPDAGKGLFLTRPTYGKATVGRYTGVTIKTAAKVRPSESHYIAQYTDPRTGKPVYIDSENSRCLVRNINESFHKVNGVYDDNCKWVVRADGLNVILDALGADLPPDTELYIRYGVVFWSTHTDLILLQQVYDKYKAHMLASEGFGYQCVKDICMKLNLLAEFIAARRCYRKKSTLRRVTVQEDYENPHSSQAQTLPLLRQALGTRHKFLDTHGRGTGSKTSKALNGGDLDLC